MKQVIVLRKDLNMRKGKMVAQGAHASLSAYLKASKTERDEWSKTGQTKICVSVESEEELLKIFHQAEDAFLPCALITDSGRTEFKEPTRTAVCIGPADSFDVDQITGHLKLL